MCTPGKRISIIFGVLTFTELHQRIDLERPSLYLPMAIYWLWEHLVKVVIKPEVFACTPGMVATTSHEVTIPSMVKDLGIIMDIQSHFLVMG